MSEPTNATEVERKLTVPTSFSLEDVVEPLSALGGLQRERVRKLVAVYYDTDDFRLARAHVTLRRRTGGTDSGWHLKLPPDGMNGDGRREVTLPLRAGRPGSVPSALANQIVAITGGAELRPLATQKTTRIPVTLLDARPDPS